VIISTDPVFSRDLDSVLKPGKLPVYIEFFSYLNLCCDLVIDIGLHCLI
jgi:hypothetical protein